jgi:hypothetical protein
MKKATKRIPVKFTIIHPITGNIYEKTVFTNDVAKYLNKYNGASASGNKWQMIPFKKYRVWLEDSVEPEGGTWWHCYADAHGYLRQEGYDHPVDELDTLDQYIQWGYKIEEI